MIHAAFDQFSTVLAIGAHPDDIEIGCGGTILQLSESRPDLTVHWVVLSGTNGRESEAKSSADKFLQSFKFYEVIQRTFTDSFFPAQWEGIKKTFGELQQHIQPDLIFTHSGSDKHQDHRVVSELTWNAFRNHLILEYEIPKYDADLGAPNVFVPLEENLVSRKIDYIHEHFKSQRDKAWFNQDVFKGLMRIRGVECAASSLYAEGFFSRKLCVRF